MTRQITDSPLGLQKLQKIFTLVPNPAALKVHIPRTWGQGF